MTKEELMAYINEHGKADEIIAVAKQMKAEGVELSREELDRRLQPSQTPIEVVQPSQTPIEVTPENALKEFVAKNRTAIEDFENPNREIESDNGAKDNNTLAIIMGVLIAVGTVLVNTGIKVGPTGQTLPHFSVLGYIGIALVLGISIATGWKLFEKAGHAGWKSLIPIYSGIVMFDIIWDSGVKFLLLFVPIFNIYWAIRSMVELGNRFSKGTGFKVGLVLLSSVFQTVLAFDDSEYV